MNTLLYIGTGGPELEKKDVWICFDRICQQPLVKWHKGKKSKNCNKS